MNNTAVRHLYLIFINIEYSKSEQRFEKVVLCRDLDKFVGTVQIYENLLGRRDILMAFVALFLMPHFSEESEQKILKLASISP